MRSSTSRQIVESERACPISGSHACEVVALRSRDGQELRNVISTNSGLIFVDPLPIPDLDRFYKESYRKDYKNTFVPKGKHIARAGWVVGERFGRISHFINEGMRTLDIGAGGGEWVYFLKKLGCDAHGIEPNVGYGNFARENYGVDVFLGMYKDASFEKESFDLITLFQVLEHLPDPVRDLRQMRDFLKPAGQFIIEVPDILYTGMHFDHKWHEGHLFGFDQRTLEWVAAKAGLRLKHILKLPGNLYAVFEKNEALELPGDEEFTRHYEYAREELLKGKGRYWREPSTYTKPIFRLPRRVGEGWTAVTKGTPKKILDSAIRKPLERSRLN